MARAAHQAANTAEVLAAVASLCRFEAHAIGVGSGFVFEEALMRMIEVSKIRKDLLVRCPGG
jgi:hypothetical protein